MTEKFEVWEQEPTKETTKSKTTKTDKRFVAIGVEWYDGFIQDHIDDCDLYGIAEVVNYLNDQDIEIRTLSAMNKALRDDIEVLKKTVSHYADITACSVEVMNEDEQLKDDYASILCTKMEKIVNENKKLEKELQECKKTKKKRLSRLKNQRVVLEETGGVILAYKGKLHKANHKIEKIQEAMEETGALTKSQLEEILK